MILMLILLGCPSPPEPQNVCSADMSWITEPSMPTEVSGDSFCDFYKFSWQWFLAQTSPSVTKGERIFETNRVYDPSISKNQCSLNLQGKDLFKKVLKPRTIKSEEFEHVQADGGALYDQNGNILYYGVFYSEEMCEASPNSFTPKTIEIKTSWMVLNEPSRNHYSIILDDKTTLGLVGMHMAIWTPNHPEMIWATWEHRDNSPMCDGSSPKKEWSFASAESATCLKNKGEKECTEYNFNIPQPFTGEPPLKSKPTNVCKEFVHGNQPEPSINGNDNAENIQTIIDINSSLIGKDGLLSKLPEDNPMHIWSNYELIGALWTKDGVNSGNLPVPHSGGTPDPNSPQRGSLELTNSTMETFQQGGSSTVPNCFGCHNYNSAQPLTVSHIYGHLK